MNKRISAGFLMLVASLCVTAMAAAEWDSERERAALQTIETFKEADPGMARLFADTWGYVVFPNVGKGGFGIGGAWGKGIVFERGTAIGWAELFQVSIGLQFGGQAYREVVFFKTREAMEQFKAGSFKLGARASAVAVTAGASADAPMFEGGVAIFTMVKGGLMYEASVSGQKFTFFPRKGAYVTTAAAAAPQPAQKDTLSARAHYESAKLAFAAGRYQEARDKWLESAHQGYVESLYELGKMFGEGQGVLQDLVTAHAYFNVAASKGHREAVQARQILDDMMSNEERAEARKRAQEYAKSFSR